MAEQYGLIGADLDATLADSTDDPAFALGTVTHGVDGTKWMYVHASGAIAQYDCVGIDENYEAAAMTKTIADDGWAVGFAQVAFADNDYGWVAISGSNISVNVLASCAADVVLYTSGTAGKLDDNSTSQTQIAGVVIVATDGGSGSAIECIATMPRSKTF
jgi:hypothetical protein